MPGWASRGWWRRQRPGPARLVSGLLLAARPAPAAASRLGRELASRGAAARAVLAPLAGGQAAEMAARCLAAVGRELAPGETAAVVARSAGLPLLIEDLLAALLAR